MASINISLDELLSIIRDNINLPLYVKPFLISYRINGLIKSISYDDENLCITIKYGMFQTRVIKSIKNAFNSNSSIKNDYLIDDDKIYIKLNKLIEHLGIKGLNIKKVVFKNNSFNVIFNGE